MQHYCRKCHHVYHNSLHNCPTCNTPQDALVEVSEDLGEALAKVILHRNSSQLFMKRFDKQQKINDKMIATMDQTAKVLGIAVDQISKDSKRIKILERNLGL